MSYPKWLYHKTEPAKIVQNEAEETKLGIGWADTPAAFEQSPVEQKPKTNLGQETVGNSSETVSKPLAESDSKQVAEENGVQTESKPKRKSKKDSE